MSLHLKLGLKTTILLAMFSLNVIAQEGSEYAQVLDQAGNYLVQHDQEAARAAYSRALELEPDNAMNAAARMGLIMTFEKNGFLQEEECREWARKHFADARLQEGVEKAMEEYGKRFNCTAEEELKETLSQDIASLPAKVQKGLSQKLFDLTYDELVRGGEALHRKGKTAEGRLLLAKALASENDSQTLSRAAASLVQTFQGAVQVDTASCKSWAEANIPSPEGRLRIELAVGELQYRNQSYDQAIAQLESVAAKEGHVAESAALVMALCLQAKWDVKGAVELLDDVAGKTTSEQIASKAVFLIGWTYVQAQQFGDAVTSFDYLVKKYPQSEFADKAAELSSRMKSYVE